MAEPTIKTVMEGGGTLHITINELIHEIEDLHKTAKNGFNSSADAIRFLDRVYQIKEVIAATIKTPLEKLYDSLRFTTIPNLMDAEEVTSITVEGVGRCNVMDDLQSSVKDADALQTWLIEHDFEDMIKQTVNAQTLSAFMRRRLREGAEVPPESVVKVTPVVRAQITR